MNKLSFTLRITGIFIGGAYFTGFFNRLTGLTDYYILSDEYYFTYYNYILQCFLTDKCLFFQILIIILP